MRQGITFNVYGDSQGAERIFPFDLLPRIIPAGEWSRLSVDSSNASRRSIFPARHLSRAAHSEGRSNSAFLCAFGQHFRREFVNFAVPKDIYIHICGTDLIRGEDGKYMVLEDNGRTPAASVTCSRTAGP